MTSPTTPPEQTPGNAPAPEPTRPASVPKPKEIPREQLDHEAPADPDPDDPASP